MSRRTTIVACFALLLLASAGTPSKLHGQATDPLERAFTSYRNLEYDDAATRLRAALAATGAARLSDADRTRALMYLAASELFRGRRDVATESIRTLLLADPRYRPDDLIFPPEVTALFQEARLGVRAVSVVVPPVSEIQSTAERFPVRVYASSLHDIRAQITDAFGSPERTLHEGAVGDSLQLLWNGRDGIGRLREPGRYLLRVTSRSPAGRDEREVEIPLDIERIVLDTLPTPAPLDPAIFRPESEVRSRGVRPLLAGLFTAAAVVALPSIAGSGEGGMPLRFGVAGALGVSAVIGMTTASRPRVLRDNVAWNRRQREEWDREFERVRAENDARRAATRIRIRAGRATTVEIK